MFPLHEEPTDLIRGSPTAASRRMDLNPMAGGSVHHHGRETIPLQEEICWQMHL